MLNRIITALEKVNIPEFIDLRRELEVARVLNPHAESLAQLKLLALKNAHKNSAKAVEALKHLELADEALQFHGVLTREVFETQREVNAPE